MKFDNLEVKKYIYNALTDLNFVNFTQVQHEVIDKFLSKKNMLVKSKTGSGKTHAFMVPIFNNLDESSKQVQALIIAPTTELATQLYKVAQHIASFSPNTINIKLYCGGTNRLKEIDRLKNEQPQIVIGTPGKIKDLAIDENVLKIHTTKNFIIDEVDMVLNEGFLEELDQILSACLNTKILFFSATVNDELQNFVKKYIETPEYINISSDTKLSIEHNWIALKHHEKKDMLTKLMKIINPYLAIIFVNKKEYVNDVASIVKQAGYAVGTIHGDLSPRERKRALAQANELKYQFIVATDLAARGIDLDGVSHVINYDLPNDFEFYIHRSGRTGRMNYSGIVYSFYTSVDDRYLDSLNQKGIIPAYKEIKNDELVEHKGRNSRQNRVKPLTVEYQQARKMVKKPSKVKPGYKAKNNQKINELASKIKKRKKKY